MENRITTLVGEPVENERRREKEAQPIGEILEELFALYRVRFPTLQVAVVETPVNVL
jgi:hypothetical protein